MLMASREQLMMTMMTMMAKRRRRRKTSRPQPSGLPPDALACTTYPSRTVKY
jgi:hypothetical protein